MKLLTKKIVTIFVVIALLSPYAPLQTASEADFNPHLILSDAELQNRESMNREDIQAFLEHHQSYLAYYRTQDASSTERIASDIIYRAASLHRINPKYLLVKLQKEQSLITDPNPTQKQLDWATGYGVCDDCSTRDPDIQKHRGFGVQVDSAAAIMRWYYDNLDKEPWIKRAGRNYLIDGTTVAPVTLATAFLYTYTPHIHGNKNFWVLWQRWFDQVYPDGTLVKSKNAPTVYLIRQGKKRPFATMAALATRFDPKLIVTAPETELTRYETVAPIKLPNYSIVKTNGTYYLLDNDSARPFANYDVVKKLGYHPEEIIEVDSADLEAYQNGTVIGEQTASPLGRVVQIKETNGLYYVVNETTYQPISAEQIINVNFPHLSVEKISVAELGEVELSNPIRFKDGTLLGIKGSPMIYVIENGKKRHIADEAVFTGLGYKWENIIWTDQFTGLNHPTAQPIYLREETSVADVSTTTIAADIGNQNEARTSSNEKMIRTPAEATKFAGQIFSTDINTYLVADQKTGEVIAGKNIDGVRPLASFAKVMTAYQLQKEGINLSRSTTYNAAKHKALYHQFRTVEGERFLNRDLLDAALVSSLNTPLQMLVDSVEPSEEKFVARLNKQIKDWGLVQTKFIDTTGERNETQTTAREYLTVYLKATNNVDVKAALTKPSYTYNELRDLDGKPYHYDTHSNELLERADALPFRIISSKTGFLEEAGAGLIMDIERKTDSRRFVIITMGNPDFANRFAEPERLARWAVESF